MKEFIDKLISELKEEHEGFINRYGIVGGNVPASIVKRCMGIVNELAEEYNVSEIPTGWIPCSERLPKRNECVLCYAKSTARGGDTWFVGSCDNGFWFLQSSIGTLSYPTQYEVIAWMPLPAPYTEGE